MKFFVGVMVGWFLALWWQNPMYACDTCDQINHYLEIEIERVCRQLEFQKNPSTYLDGRLECLYDMEWFLREPSAFNLEART